MMKRILFTLVFIGMALGAVHPATAIEATLLNPANRPAHTQAIPIFTNESTIAASTVYDIGFLASEHTWMLDFTGSPTSVSIAFQGTIDGANWFALDTYTGTTDTMRHVVNKPVRKIRVDLATLDTGDVTVKTIHGGN
jgi:hypothetical protein